MLSSFIFLLYSINLCNSWIIFGFETSLNMSTESVSASSNMLMMTLYWNASQYQCRVQPSQANTYYSCNTSNITNTFQCDTSLLLSNIIPLYGMKLDNHGTNTIQIDKLIITDYTNDMTLIFKYFYNYFQANIYNLSFNITIPPDFPYKLIHFMPYEILNISYNQNSNDLECDVYNETKSTICIPFGYACINVFNTDTYGGT
eukprot:144445_1